MNDTENRHLDSLVRVPAPASDLLARCRRSVVPIVMLADPTREWFAYAGSVHSIAGCPGVTGSALTPTTVVGPSPWAELHDGAFDATPEDVFVTLGAHPCRCVDGGGGFAPDQLRNMTFLAALADPVTRPDVAEEDLFALWMQVRTALRNLHWDRPGPHIGPLAAEVLAGLDQLPGLSADDVNLWMGVEAAIPDALYSPAPDGMRAADHHRTLTDITFGLRNPHDYEHINRARAVVDDQRKLVAFARGASLFITMILRATAHTHPPIRSFDPSATVVPWSVADHVYAHTPHLMARDLVPVEQTPPAAVLEAAAALWTDGMSAAEALAVASAVIGESPWPTTP